MEDVVGLEDVSRRKNLGDSIVFSNMLVYCSYFSLSRRLSALLLLLLLVLSVSADTDANPDGVYTTNTVDSR